MKIKKLQAEIDELKKSYTTYAKILISPEVIREINDVQLRVIKLKGKEHEDIIKEIPELEVILLLKNIDLMLYAMNSKTVDSTDCKSLVHLSHFLYGVLVGMMELAYPHLTQKNQSKFDTLRKRIKNAKALNERFQNLWSSDPKEQKLFELVLDFYNNADRLIKYVPAQVFKQINNKHKLIKSDLIPLEGFTSSDLYNRWKQFRLRKRKKES